VHLGDVLEAVQCPFASLACLVMAIGFIILEMREHDMAHELSV
jgi:hypothetical protein